MKKIEAQNKKLIDNTQSLVELAFRHEAGLNQGTNKHTKARNSKLREETNRTKDGKDEKIIHEAPENFMQNTYNTERGQDEKGN